MGKVGYCNIFIESDEEVLPRKLSRVATLIKLSRFSSQKDCSVLVILGGQEVR